MRKKIFYPFVFISILVLGLKIISSMFTKPLPSDIKVDKIVVVKHKRILQLISGNTVIKTYRISLGKCPKGAKEFEGDKKTPEGLYTINDKNPNSKYYKNLGISYPNEGDKEHAKRKYRAPGGHVKIHGLNKKHGWWGKLHLFRDWTAGCIAVTNSEMEELYNAVPIGTPIEILP